MPADNDQMTLHRTYHERAVGAALLCIVFLSKAPHFYLPYNWDEMSAYMGPTYWLAHGSLARFIPGLYPPHMFFGHPPALYLSVAFLFKMFGEKIWVAHLFVTVFSFLGVYFTYLLASHMFDRRTGLAAALLLFLSPLYFAQSGMVHADLIVTALGVMCAYFAIREKYIPYLICGLYMVMVKESAAAIILSIILFHYISGRKDPGTKIRVLKYALPLIPLTAFFLLQKIATGFFLPNPYFESNRFFVITSKSIGWAFFLQGRILLTFLILLNYFINKSAWRKEFTLFSLIILFFTGAYSFIYCTPRYILPVLPSFFILSAYAITQLLRDAKLQAAAVLAVIILFIGQSFGSGKGGGSFETDMQYVDVVLNHKEACRYVEDTFPGKTVLAVWPVSEALSYPYLGYVNKPVTVVSDINKPSDIILYTRQGHPDNERLIEFIKRHNLRPHKIFEKNGKYAEVYIKDTSSARQ